MQAGRFAPYLWETSSYDGKEGHATRHCLVLAAIYDAIRRVAGSSSLEHEPTNYRGYSDHRPDLTTSYSGFKIWDLKLLDPFGSTPALDMSARGAFAAFGNTVGARRVRCLWQHCVPSAGDGAEVRGRCVGSRAKPPRRARRAPGHRTHAAEHRHRPAHPRQDPPFLAPPAIARPTPPSQLKPRSARPPLTRRTSGRRTCCSRLSPDALRPDPPPCNGIR